MGQDAGMFPRCSRASYHVARGSRDAIGRTRFDSSRRIDKLGDVLRARRVTFTSAKGRSVRGCRRRRTEPGPPTYARAARGTASEI